MAKRPNGEGSHRHRPDGKWECRYRLPNGVRKSLYGRTLEEVKAKRKQVERDIDAGLDPSKPSQTVKEFLTTWLANTAQSSVRPRTYISYEQLVKKHIVPSVGDVKLAGLTPQQVERMMREMVSAGLAPATAQQARAVLRRALGFALKWGLVTRNVAALATPPRSVKKPVKPLTTDQTHAFLHHVREANHRHWPLFTVAAYTGLRAGELYGLRWSDVDLNAGTLRVVQTVVRLPGGWAIGEPKTEKSARPLPLVPEAIEALRVEKDLQKFRRNAAGGRWQDHSLVFTTTVGTPCNASNVNVILHDALEAAGLPHMGMHGFRHGCASMLLEKGVHMRVVMEWLGHSQISLTMNTYSHVAPTVLQDAARALATG
jgi:integrase